MSERTVLYDAPGPRARLITLVSSVVAAMAAVAFAYYFVYRPLDEAGQFSAQKWGPLIDPSNESFGPVWRLFAQGFAATAKAASLAIVFSLIAGTALAVLRIQLKALMRRRFVGVAAGMGWLVRALVFGLNAITRFCVEVFRGIPVVITIFFVWVGLPNLGVNFEDRVGYLVIGLTIYNGVVIGEILRSGMEGLPPGQREAADALGLTQFQTTRLVLLPQAYRIMLPALISQLVVVLKDTSLGFIISYEEILRVGKIVSDNLGNLIQTYFVVGVIYISVNYALSKLAGYTQRRLARGRKTAATMAGARAPAALSAEAQTLTAGPAPSVRPAPTAAPVAVAATDTDEAPRST
jgi:glutamate transport system permease protein